MPLRSIEQGPWHLCSRCGRKTKISNMIRQRGSLICSRPSCKDEALIGDRDVVISRKLNDIANSKEMQPDTRLVDNTITSAQDEIFF